MKTSLKRSEIIEQLKLFFPTFKTISILRESIIVEDDFNSYYVCLISRGDLFQTITIHLNHGWVSYILDHAFGGLMAAEYIYFRELSRLGSVIEKEHVKLPF